METVETKEQSNYGITEGRGPEAGTAQRVRTGRERIGSGPAAMSAREERRWSVLAHLSTFLNIFTVFLGPVAALGIWFTHRDRSPKVASNALQSAT